MPSGPPPPPPPPRQAPGQVTLSLASLLRFWRSSAGKIFPPPQNHVNLDSTRWVAKETVELWLKEIVASERYGMHGIS